jgi:hypothetical protein
MKVTIIELDEVAQLKAELEAWKHHTRLLSYRLIQVESGTEEAEKWLNSSDEDEILCPF